MANTNTILALSNNTVVSASGTDVRIIRDTTEIDLFSVDDPVEWLKISPDGQGALIYARHGMHVWLWREGVGHKILATATSSREAFGCGFAELNDEILTLFAQSGVLRGLTQDGREKIVANIRSPHSFYPRNFVQLPGSRLAMVGNFFGDPFDVAVTVSLDTLQSNPGAVQAAIQAKLPIWDRAIDITVGPYHPDGAVVLRDPEDTEIPEDEEDLEDLGDVGNFTGIYLRDLSTGDLIERLSYTGGAGSGAPIVATADLIAVQVVGGIDLIQRGSGTVHKFRALAAALDTANAKVAWLHGDQHIEMVPVATLL